MKINYALPFRALFAVIAASLLPTADAQWVQQADFPGTSRLWSSCFSIGDKIYYGVGATSEPGGYEAVDDFWMFDTGSNSWTQRASFPNGGLYASAGFAIGNKGYLATGFTSAGGTTNNIWEYDPVADTWTIKAPLPGSPRGYSAGFVIGAYGYVAAGQNGSTPLSDLWRYDPAGDSWLQMSPFGGSGEQSFAFVIGTDAYVGGSYGMLPLWKYNSSNDSWLQRADQPVFGGGAVFALGGIGYAVNGIQSYTYSPATDLWSTVSGPPSSAFGWDRGVTVDGSGYVLPGDDSSVWELTGTTGINGNRSAMAQLSVFPNPTNGDLVLQLVPQAQARSISILDATSRMVLMQPVPFSSNLISMDLSGHENGVYFLQVRFSDGTQAVQRIVKE